MVLGTVFELDEYAVSLSLQVDYSLPKDEEGLGLVSFCLQGSTENILLRNRGILEISL